MSRQDRLDWVSRGSPFWLMRPAGDLRDRLRRYGYTVYDIGNRSHLEHQPPEDHTPYSQTGWPGKARYGVGYAIDIMPPTKAGLPSLQRLGAQILADRNAGDPQIRWLKYMNWEPRGDNRGPCYHESWQPSYSRRTSSDRGHIHLSGLTGYEDSITGRAYDPVARLRGEDDTVDQATIDKIAAACASKVLAAKIRRPTGSPTRTLDDVASDLSNERNFGYAKPGTAGLTNPPPPGSTLDLLAKMVAGWPTLLATVASVHTAVQADPVDEAALATALAPLLLDQLTADQLADAVAARPEFAEAVVAAIAAKLTEPGAEPG